MSNVFSRGQNPIKFPGPWSNALVLRTVQVAFRKLSLSKVGLADIGLGHDDTRKVESGSIRTRQRALTQIIKLVTGGVGLAH